VTSVLAVDALVLLGAALQLGLVLRARRFAAGDAARALGLFAAVPSVLFALLLAGPRSPDSVGLGFVGVGVGLLCAGWFVTRHAPARVTSAGLVSLSVSFWIALAPEIPFGVWWLLAAAATALALACAFGPWRAPKSAVLVLYFWFLFAAGALAVTGISGEALYALVLRPGEFGNPVPPAAALLTGAQACLLLQFVCGLYLLLLDDEKDPGKRFASQVARKSVSLERLNARAVGVIVLQAAALLYVRSRGAEAESSFAGLAALGALAHGAMSGEEAR
jgi:hypothetical protein